MRLTAENFADWCKHRNVALDKNGKYLLLGAVDESVTVKDRQKRLRFNPEGNTFKQVEYDPNGVVSMGLKSEDIPKGEAGKSIAKFHGYHQALILSTDWSDRMFHTGIEIKGFDPKLREMAGSKIEGTGDDAKLFIQKKSTPIYFRLTTTNGDDYWKKFVLSDKNKKKNQYVFTSTRNDKVKTETTPERFIELCKYGYVSLDPAGGHLLLGKYVKKKNEVKDNARVDLYGDDYHDRLSRLMQIVKRLKMMH